LASRRVVRYTVLFAGVAAVLGALAMGMPSLRARLTFVQAVVVPIAMLLSLVALIGLRRLVRPRTRGVLEERLAPPPVAVHVPEEARAAIASVRSAMRSRRGYEEDLLPRLAGTEKREQMGFSKRLLRALRRGPCAEELRRLICDTEKGIE